MTAEQLAKGTDIYERCECLKRDCASLTKGMPHTKSLRIAGMDKDWDETFEIVIGESEGNEIIGAVGDLLAGNFKRKIENLLEQFANL